MMKAAIWKRSAGWLAAWLVSAVLLVLTGEKLILWLVLFMPCLTALSVASALLAKKKLTFSMEFTGVGTKKETVSGWLEACNSSRLPIAAVLCRVVMENRLTGEINTKIVSLSPGTRKSVRVSLELTSQFCGYIKLYLDRVYAMDMTGCIPLPVKVKCAAKFTSLPELQPTHLIMSCPPSTPEDGEFWLEGRKGSDYSEILQLRDYVPGDPVKQIHWKLTSKLDKLIVRDPSYPVSRSLLVFWDKTAAAAKPAQMDAMAETVCSICRAISEQGFAYTLCWNDGMKCHLQLIQTEEELLQIMPLLLKSGCKEAENTALTYLPEKCGATFSKILYFAVQSPAEALLDDFAADSNLTLLLCSTQDVKTAYPVISYTPETYPQLLQSLELDT